MSRKRKKRPGKCEAKQLPSGNWRVRITRNGVTKSFTGATKNEAEYAANKWAYSEDEKAASKVNLTVEQAMTEYVKSRDKIRAPSGIRAYKGIIANAIDDIRDILLNDLSKQEIQNWINKNAERYAPKTIKSQYGLLTATLRYYDIDPGLKYISIPTIPPNDRPVPTEEEIKLILEIVEETSIELAVTMALTLGLRQGEIAGLKWMDYDGSRLNIHAEITLDENGKYVYQERTKSSAGVRTLEVPAILKERLDRAQRTSDYISPMRPSSILKKFKKICAENGLPEYRMHDNRHANASLMLAHGIPDKYAMQRLGQSSLSMLKKVYQHLSDEMIDKTAEMISDAFDEIVTRETADKSTKIITLALSEDKAKALESKAKAAGMTISEYIESLI